MQHLQKFPMNFFVNIAPNLEISVENELDTDFSDTSDHVLTAISKYKVQTHRLFLVLGGTIPWYFEKDQKFRYSKNISTNRCIN